MATNTTPDNLLKPQSIDQVAPLETVLSNMMDSVQTALVARGKQTSQAVGSAAARDALFPSPVSGNRVFRADKGWTEVYYTSVSGLVAADGWYPIAGVLPVSERYVSAGFSFGTTRANINFNAVTRELNVTWNSGTLQWTVTQSGWYHIYADAAMTNNTVNFQIYIRKNGSDVKLGEAYGAPTGNNTLRVETWVRLAAGDLIDIQGAASGSTTVAVGSTRTTGFIEYVGPA